MLICGVTCVFGAQAICMQGGGALQIGDLQFMVAGEDDGMMVKGALPKGTIRE